MGYSPFDHFREDELCFDLNNPRLVEFGLTRSSSEEDVIKILWEAMDAREIALSIVASGYFENDPLIVAIEEDKKIVIEGNRRLAAVRVLKHPEKYSDIRDIPHIDAQAQNDLNELPVIIQSRQDAWKFLGFKHVNGPAKWGSYAKAKYIADVHRSYGIPLEEIGKQIGDTHRTVQRLFNGLMVIEQAERAGVFSREDVTRKTFAFSHLYVGLQREGIQKFLGIDDPTEETENPVPAEKISELGELCKWLYGSKEDNIEPVIQSQNPDLKNLDLVLQNREALAALRSGEPLSIALEFTQPAARVFEDQLMAAKRSLIKARGLLSEGYDGSEALLRIAGSVAEIADDLYDEMERKRNPEKKKRITE